MKKELFVGLATHIPTARSFICSIESLIKRFRENPDLHLQSTCIDDTSRLRLQLTDHIATARPPDFQFDEQKQSTMIQCTIDNLIHKDAAEILDKLRHHAGKVLTGEQMHTAVQSIEVKDGELTAVFKKPIKMKKSESTYERLLLVDGSNLLSRSYFATSHTGELMTNAEGLFTNAVYVFIRKLFSLISRYSITHVVVCWDVGRTETFRREIHPEYKGLRSETEPQLKQQYGTTEGALAMMNIPQVRVDGFEADDLIGTIANLWRDHSDGECLIYSNDKDMYQLLDDEGQVRQVISKKREESLYSAEQFQKEFKVTPAQWIDIKAILGETGSSSDNIPGCKGVGPAGAYPLIQKFQSVENLYENIKAVEEDKALKRYAKKLAAGEEEVFLSKKLATIVTDVKELQGADLDQYKLKIDESGKLRAFKWLGFKSIA